jgi:hypothetical protein
LPHFTFSFLLSLFSPIGYDKLFYWKDNLQWMKGHFAKTHLKSCHGASTCSRFKLWNFMHCGLYRVIVNNGRIIWFYGAVFSCINFTYVAFGQRLAKITMEQELLLFTSYRQ